MRTTNRYGRIPACLAAACVALACGDATQDPASEGASANTVAPSSSGGELSGAPEPSATAGSPVPAASNVPVAPPSSTEATTSTPQAPAPETSATEVASSTDETSATPTSSTVAAATDATTSGSSSDPAPSTSPPSPPAAAGDGCTVGAWPSLDPAVAGPFATVTETNVGPAAGEGDDGPVAYTVFRPADLAATGLCHPVVTWGNGTGANPSLYKGLLDRLASHGFVVVASDSPNVGQGSPPPMVAGVTWIIEENDNPESEYYQRIDTTHVGATGHSQGGFATTQAGSDSQITTIAPLCGASGGRDLNGPALLLCGGQDDVVACDGIQRTYEGISGPAMFANYLTADHTNWVTFRGTTLSPMELAVTAWMRVQLMGDTELRSWFYGPSCKLCTDDAWQIAQNMMD